MADQVMALRAASTPEAAQAPPVAGTAPQQASPATSGKASDAQASQAAADDLHHQADAAIPAGSQLATSLATSLASTSRNTGKASQEAGAEGAVSPGLKSASGSAEAVPGVQSEADKQGPAASSTTEEAEDQVAPEAAGSSHMGAAGRTPPPDVKMLRSNPRFATKLIKQGPDADGSVVNSHEGGSAKTAGSTVYHCVVTCQGFVI